MRRAIRTGLAVAVAGVALATLHAQAPAQSAVYAVAYVDVTASGQPAAVIALKVYRQAVSREAGHLRTDVLDQIGRPGHFVLVETWRDQAAFDTHAGGAAWTQFQQALDTVRVSGYDQRPYKPLDVAMAAAAAGRPIHVVSHVDIGGGAGLAGAPAMLRQLADASRKERGNLRFDVLQHAMRANHFTVVESWADQAALDAHAAAAHTRRYRDALQPISGSPLDERVYLAIE